MTICAIHQPNLFPRASTLTKLLAADVWQAKHKNFTSPLIAATPLVLLIYFSGIAVPRYLVELSSYWYLVIALALYNGSVIAEVLRAGVLALGRGQRLRIAHARDPMTAGLHDDGRGHDRPARRGHADLVDAGDASQSLVPQAALMAKGRDDRAHRPSG